MQHITAMALDKLELQLCDDSSHSLWINADGDGIGLRTDDVNNYIFSFEDSAAIRSFAQQLEFFADTLDTKVDSKKGSSIA